MEKQKEKRKLIRQLTQPIPLNKKFTFGMIAVLIVPIAIILLVVFSQIEKSQVGQAAADSLNELERTELYVGTNVDTASAIIQSIKANSQITDYVSRPITTDELVRFNRQTTPYLENITITNPYIRSLRIYCNSERLPERWPVFVSGARVENQGWFNGLDSKTVSMRIGYSEKLSEYSQQLSGQNIISFSGALNEEEGAGKAAIEISFTMGNFFGEAYTGNEKRFCFLYKDENIYADTSAEYADGRLLVASAIAPRIIGSGNQHSIEILDGIRYLTTIYESSSLNGSLIMVRDLSDVLGRISLSRFILIVIITALIILLALIYNSITKVLLGRIYQTIAAMRSVEQGNTRVKIENISQDEIGQLQFYFNEMLDKIDYLVDQNTKRSLLEKDAEIKALQNQINSHFLYNVLNNIEMMAVIDGNDLIADTVTALGRLLRYSMNWKNQLVPLSGELSHVQDYLQLFNIRFDNEIQLICDVEEGLDGLYIPKMSLQPIVENAVVHGIENSAKDAVIIIAAFGEEGRLVIEVTDSGSGMDEKTLNTLNESLQGKENSRNLTGIGLVNVQERIELYYGAEYGITVNSKLGAYTKVTIKMPLNE